VLLGWINSPYFKEHFSGGPESIAAMSQAVEEIAAGL
jgi:hypothetical protein